MLPMWNNATNIVEWVYLQTANHKLLNYLVQMNIKKNITLKKSRSKHGSNRLKISAGMIIYLIEVGIDYFF